MKYLLSAFIIIFVFITTSCGGGGSSSPTTATINIEGVWTITETGKPSNCAVPAPPETFDLTVTQNGSSITIEDEDGNIFAGTLSGSILSWSGSYYDEAPNGVPGTTTLNSMTSTIDASCNSLTGSASWTWAATDGSGYICTGTTTFTGTRTPASGCGSTAAPVAPTELTASAASSSSISLTWSDNSDNETSFVLQSSTTSGTGYSTIATLAADATSYNHTGLSASTTYYYRVYSSNDVGDSNYSNEAYATTDAPPTIPPTPPSNLTATATSSSSINLNWIDSSSNEATFVLQSSTTSGTGYSTIATLLADATSYNHTNLNGSTTYYYRIYASNGAGDSSYSNEAFATTDVTPVGVPTPPSNLAATGSSSSSISLSWTDASNNETGFEIWSSPSSMLPLTKKATVGANVTSYNDTGLSPSITYRYAVLAFNNDGSSALSNSVSATTSSTVVTQTYNAATDNLLVINSLDSTVANTPSPAGDNSVGCDWIYNSLTFTQDFLCFKSLIYFGVDADINGKTIISATLKLYPVFLPVEYTQYEVWAVYNYWSSSVTWNTEPLLYSGSGVVFNNPISTLPSEINVTSIVQNWANGTYTNYGFMVEDTNYSFPYDISFRATAFCSTEGVPSCTQPPQLEITYQ